jgi:hypothetical protein
MGPLQFLLVDWNAHERAFKRLTCQQKILVSKLVHGLANTNRQNHLYYNTSNLCPICNAVEETFEHILTYQHPSAISFRDASLLQMEKDLQRINTPIMVIRTIMHGFSEWLHPNRSSHSRAPTVGSLRGPDMVLTTA